MKRWCRRIRPIPTLTGAAGGLKATDANVAIARAAGRPQVSGTVGVNQDLSRSGIIQTAGQRTATRLGRDWTSATLYSTAAASEITSAPPRSRVEAGRGTLRAVEGDVFTQAVTAYMDVIRDRAIVELNQNNVKVLDHQPRGDARPLPDRRPYPNRRRAVRSAASARPLAARCIAGSG